jgi:hypothetical protein
MKLAGSALPWLKPALIFWLYAGVKTPVSLRIEFFRNLFSRADEASSIQGRRTS